VSTSRLDQLNKKIERVKQDKEDLIKANNLLKYYFLLDIINKDEFNSKSDKLLLGKEIQEHLDHYNYQINQYERVRIKELVRERINNSQSQTWKKPAIFVTLVLMLFSLGLFFIANNSGITGLALSNGTENGTNESFIVQNATLNTSLDLGSPESNESNFTGIGTITTSIESEGAVLLHTVPFLNEILPKSSMGELASSNLVPTILTFNSTSKFPLLLIVMLS